MKKHISLLLRDSVEKICVGRRENLFIFFSRAGSLKIMVLGASCVYRLKCARFALNGGEISTKTESE